MLRFSFTRYLRSQQAKKNEMQTERREWKKRKKRKKRERKKRRRWLALVLWTTGVCNKKVFKVSGF